MSRAKVDHRLQPEAPHPLDVATGQPVEPVGAKNAATSDTTTGLCVVATDIPEIVYAFKFESAVRNCFGHAMTIGGAGNAIGTVA